MTRRLVRVSFIAIASWNLLILAVDLPSHLPLFSYAFF